MFLHLTRLNDDTDQTIGRLALKDDNGKTIFSMSTLELPWEHNITKESCIPCGFYVVKKRYSLKYGLHLHILNVSGRELILIHSGNFKTDTKGCILVGDSLKDINNDGLLDVINSKRTLKFLLEMMPLATTIKIVNAPNVWKV